MQTLECLAGFWSATCGCHDASENTSKQRPNVNKYLKYNKEKKTYNCTKLSFSSLRETFNAELKYCLEFYANTQHNYFNGNSE
jgi:hypothetical protein